MSSVFTGASFLNFLCVLLHQVFKNAEEGNTTQASDTFTIL